MLRSIETGFQFGGSRLLLALLLATSLVACHRGKVQTQSPDTNQPCLEVVLTGTQGGPPQVGGLAGPGTLVRIGTAENGCSDVLLQFDAGRGTVGQLSRAGVSVTQLDAVFLTHMHSDHTEGLAGVMQLRWHYVGGSLDIVCSSDITVSSPPPGRTISCRSYLEHIGDAFLASGEIAQRFAENGKRDPGGPATLARLKTVVLPLPTQPGNVVWSQGEVIVTAIGSRHTPGHLSYRVDSPAGSVVIGGDAGNDNPAPPREGSTSLGVETLAKGADLLVHSSIHPVFAPGAGSTFPARVYYRQSTASDLGAMAQRAGVKQLILTHLIPALGSEKHGVWAIPGGALQAGDFKSAAKQTGFEGQVHVGTDLLSIKLP